MKGTAQPVKKATEVEEDAPPFKHQDTLLVEDNSDINEDSPHLMKDELMTTKECCYAIGKEKVAYRRSNEKPSIVVRDLYPTTTYKAFGVEGEEHIIKVFMAMMSLLVEKGDKLIKLAKYKSEIEKMVGMAKELAEESMLMEYEIDNVKTSHHKMKTVTVRIDDERSLCVSLVLDSKYPQFRLSNHVNEQLTTGVYLFISEAISLPLAC